MSVQGHAQHAASRHALTVASVLLTMVVAACNRSANPATASIVPATSLPSPIASPSPSLAIAPASPTPVPTSSASALGLPALTLLWQKGGPKPSQPETWRPAIDPATGDIWVAASFDNVFWIFSPDGKYLGSWGTPGKGDGQLALTTREENPTPRGSIAFVADGSFYVADSGNNRVQKFDKDRHFVLSFGGFGHQNGKFTRPLDIATDGRTVFVSDDDRNDLQEFGMDGTYLRSLPWSAYGMSTVDRAGRIVTSKGGDVDPTDLAVLVVDPVSGQPIATYALPPIGRITLGVAVDGAGDIFVNVAPDGDSAPHITVGLVELDKTGKMIGTWSTAGETVAVAPDGKAVYLGSDWTFIRKYALPTP